MSELHDRFKKEIDIGYRDLLLDLPDTQEKIKALLGNISGNTATSESGMYVVTDDDIIAATTSKGKPRLTFLKTITKRGFYFFEDTYGIIEKDITDKLGSTNVKCFLLVDALDDASYVNQLLFVYISKDFRLFQRIYFDIDDPDGEDRWGSFIDITPGVSGLDQIRTDIRNLNKELSKVEVSLGQQIDAKVAERLQLYRPSENQLPIATREVRGILNFEDIPYATFQNTGVVRITRNLNQADGDMVATATAVNTALGEMQDKLSEIDEIKNAVNDHNSLIEGLDLKQQIGDYQKTTDVRSTNERYGLTRLASVIQAGNTDVVTSDLLNVFRAKTETDISEVANALNTFKLLFAPKVNALEDIVSKASSISVEQDKIIARKPIEYNGSFVVTDKTLMSKISDATTTTKGIVKLTETLTNSREHATTSFLVKTEVDSLKEKINRLESVLEASGGLIRRIRGNGFDFNTATQTGLYFLELDSAPYGYIPKGSDGIAVTTLKHARLEVFKIYNDFILQHLTVVLEGASDDNNKIADYYRKGFKDGNNIQWYKWDKLGLSAEALSSIRGR